MSFGNRLKELRLKKGLTQQEMLENILNELTRIEGQSAKLSLGTYRNWEQDVSIPNSYYLKVLVPLLGTTTDYLLGVNVQENHTFINPYIEATIKSMSNMNDKGKEQVADYANLLDTSGKYKNENPKIIDIRDYYKADSLGTVAAGSGFQYRDYVQNTRLFMTMDVPKYDFSLDVKGDSMFPTIEDSEVVFLTKVYDKTDYDIYAIDVDGKTYVKRVIFEDDKLTLISDNEEYDDIVITGYELKQTRILGRVVGWEMPVK